MFGVWRVPATVKASIFETFREIESLLVPLIQLNSAVLPLTVMFSCGEVTQQDGDSFTTV
jgi:hypothetical protein